MHEDGRSGNEISTTLELPSSSAREWKHGVELNVASLDLKQAFDKLSPPLLSKAMKDAGHSDAW